MSSADSYAQQVNDNEKAFDVFDFYSRHRAEWQKVIKHSEFVHWSYLYESEQAVSLWLIYCDWLQENGFTLEERLIRGNIENRKPKQTYRRVRYSLRGVAEGTCTA